jgi:2-C-methyl-D-erythritol 4-phosphate cytidylyltransferase
LESVKSGLACVDKKYKIIAVHDGARPLLTAKDAQKCISSALKNKAAVLAVAVKDTIKEVKNGFVIKTLNRSSLWAAQTPQCYDAQTLTLAIKKYGRFKNVTDESQLVEKLGVKIAAVPSSYKNIKITTPEDLIIAEALCKKKK